MNIKFFGVKKLSIKCIVGSCLYYLSIYRCVMSEIKLISCIFLGLLVAACSGGGGEVNRDDALEVPDDLVDNILFDKADGINGGRLYANVWATETGFSFANSALKNMDQLTLVSSQSAFFSCHQCHGWDRKGAQGAFSNRESNTLRPKVAFMDLNEVVEGASNRELFNKIKYGSNRRDIDEDLSRYGFDEEAVAGDLMPDYSQIMTDLQIWDVVKFLKTQALDTGIFYDLQLSDGEYPNIIPTFLNIGKEGDSQYGGVVYSMACAGCHGFDGTAIVLDDGYSVGGIVRAEPDKIQHKVKFGHLGSTMGPVLASAPVQDIVDLFKALQDDTFFPDDLANIELNADGINGGQLYDTFWSEETGFSLENSALKSESQLDNIQLYADFFRCVQCHGWDRLGREGGFSDQVASDIRPNVADLDLALFARESSRQEIFSAIAQSAGRRDVDVDLSTYDPLANDALGDQMPNYAQILSRAQMWDLVEFLKTQALDTRELYDLELGEGEYPNRPHSFVNLGKNGELTKGVVVFQDYCFSCHDIETANLGDERLTVGQYIRAYPDIAQHKVKFGHLGSPMGPVLAENPVVDILNLFNVMSYEELFD